MGAALGARSWARTESWNSQFSPRAAQPQRVRLERVARVTIPEPRLPRTLDWQHLLAEGREAGEAEAPSPARSPFQRDHDRILFSGSFRRLADKTQVFPLPFDDHVHSRLTHSLEVATIGRSLGTLVGRKLATQGAARTATTRRRPCRRGPRREGGIAIATSEGAACRQRLF